jgi:hypothetical protein
MTLPSSMRGITILDGGYFGLAAKAEQEKHPETFDITGLDEKITKTLKDCRALHAKNDAAKTDPRQELRKEYSRLLNDHFNLKQQAQGAENRVNESAGQIRNHEQRLTILLNRKAETESAIGLRNIENAIVRLEGELAEEKQKYSRLRTENLNAVKALKAFDGARLVALKAELDAPAPKP